MNVVNISYLSRQEIESAFHTFDKEQLEAAVSRLLVLAEADLANYARDSTICVCNFE